MKRKEPLDMGNQRGGVVGFLLVHRVTRKMRMVLTRRMGKRRRRRS